MSQLDPVPEFVRGDFKVSRRDLTVEWGHCDPAGIVFHPRFIEYFDWSCVVLFEQLAGWNKTELGRRFGFAGFPIIDLNTKFLKPIHYDDQVQIFSTITALRKSSFEIRHCLTKSEVVAVECVQTRVWCVADPADPKKLKSSPVPQELIACLKRSL
jgi:4-hydroxybenzoyl-CoA thioesterase